MKFRMVLTSPLAVEPPEVEPPDVPELEVPPDVTLGVAPLPPLPVPAELVPLVAPPLLVDPLPLLEPWPNKLSRSQAPPLMPLELEPEPPEVEPFDDDPLESVEPPLSHALPEPPPCFATPWTVALATGVDETGVAAAAVPVPANRATAPTTAELAARIAARLMVFLSLPSLFETGRTPPQADVAIALPRSRAKLQPGHVPEQRLCRRCTPPVAFAEHGA